MAMIFRFVGRILFVTLLLTSAVIKIKEPTKALDNITNGYNNIKNLHPTIKSMAPSVEEIQPYSIQTVRAIGAFEALVALMIIFGDRLGGFLLSIYLIVFTLATHGPALMKGQESIMQTLPQLVTMLLLIGFSFAFMDNRYERKQPKPV